ncbi:type II secretion system protein [uncultured Massilia sp.]|uniref:type II secretion system protein n=1 Tax=uncultured Massilia sp. TaxID=169973 RepID=UPI0025893DA3|nr:type II secretion system protein [uncultured Massilia sp.]
MRSGRQVQDGFTYLGLIVFVFIIGLVGAATLKVEALLRRAQLERELLETGAQFSAALNSYAAATPRGQPRAPMALDDLLRDKRFPNPRRHLRKVFIDPVTGKPEWGLVRAGEAGPILGVHSLSQATPLKQANFDPRFSGFENREHLAEWKFMAQETGAPVLLPPNVPARPQTPPATPAPPTPQPSPEPIPDPPQDEAPAEAPEEPPSQPQDPPGQSQDSGR